MRALRRLRLRDVLEGSRRSMLSAMRRIVARLRAEWSLRARQRRARRRAANDEGAAHGSAFAPVVVEEALPISKTPIGAEPSGGTAVIGIVIGAATVRVAPGIDAATLTAVLRAVKAAT